MKDGTNFLRAFLIHFPLLSFAFWEDGQEEANLTDQWNSTSPHRINKTYLTLESWARRPWEPPWHRRHAASASRRGAEARRWQCLSATPRRPSTSSSVSWPRFCLQISHSLPQIHPLPSSPGALTRLSHKSFPIPGSRSAVGPPSRRLSGDWGRFGPRVNIRTPAAFSAHASKPPAGGQVAC